MPKQSRETIVAGLDALRVGYSDEMSYAELCELLKQAEEELVDAVAPEEPIDLSGVRDGLATALDHEARIVRLERKLNDA